ncbi:lasso peptide biosynthesis B2 protein [Priestia filamentosa]|uniref:lasso peptide biosynthesis B2 protein n=1 Tax=Priestia filamentosa TaxID=1402861 RepID=UPI003982BB2F
MFKKVKLFLYSYTSLVLLDLKLLSKGFTKTFENYSTKYSKNFSHKHVSEEVVEDIENFFLLLNIACAWYPKKADCIEKTLIGYKVMRKKFALPVEMVIGVRKFPFEAHAWLKIDQQNLFQEEETSQYKVIISSNSYSKEQR